PPPVPIGPTAVRPRPGTPTDIVSLRKAAMVHIIMSGPLRAPAIASAFLWHRDRSQQSPLAAGSTIIPRPALPSRSPQQSSDKLDGLGTAIWWGIARITPAHASDINGPNDRGALNSTRG